MTLFQEAKICLLARLFGAEKEMGLAPRSGRRRRSTRAPRPPENVGLRSIASYPTNIGNFWAERWPIPTAEDVAEGRTCGVLLFVPVFLRVRAPGVRLTRNSAGFFRTCVIRKIFLIVDSFDCVLTPLQRRVTIDLRWLAPSSFGWTADDADPTPQARGNNNNNSFIR